jgi:Flp pilus assembly secretin CpaC
MRNMAALLLLSVISASAMAQSFPGFEQRYQSTVRDAQALDGSESERPNDAPSGVYTRISPRLTIADLRKGHVSVYKTDVPFSSIQIGDPKVVEVTASSDRTVSVLGLDKGSTNVLFLDDKGEVTSELKIAVDPPPRTRPPTAGSVGVPGRLVKVHNKALVTSYTLYVCGPDYCDYRGEMTAKEPAPLPPTRTENRYIDAKQIGGGPGFFGGLLGR